MGDSWWHVFTYIQVGASDGNKAGVGLLSCVAYFLNNLISLTFLETDKLHFHCQIYRTKSTGGEVRGLKDVVLENTNSLLDFTGMFEGF